MIDRFCTYTNYYFLDDQTNKEAFSAGGTMPPSKGSTFTFVGRNTNEPENGCEADPAHD